MAQTLLLSSNPQPRWHLRKPPLLLHLHQLYGTSEVDQCGSPATFLSVCLGVEKSIPNSSAVHRMQDEGDTFSSKENLR